MNNINLVELQKICPQEICIMDSEKDEVLATFTVRHHILSLYVKDKTGELIYTTNLDMSDGKLVDEEFNKQMPIILSKVSEYYKEKSNE